MNATFNASGKELLSTSIETLNASLNDCLNETSHEEGYYTNKNHAKWRIVCHYGTDKLHFFMTLHAWQNEWDTEDMSPQLFGNFLQFPKI